ncbi:hypothetical protein HMPREF1624_05557 [Sporothrix schenckii ATCC 58251]|uniref:Aminotransferase class I/classII large domain-containing protein n=1 Tax=Sporothrix schenckii (strain ATCC 58251 / de Perez 2211183) TaxID=1391915 RepID=U7PSG5_SPOS1|nr:hypothetical protein HMPREF1624_05557 [Sporothrix schenckii ATCC 58251]
MAPTLSESMRTALASRARKSSLRTLSVVPPDSVDFSSNDFLSLSVSAALHGSFVENLRTGPLRLGSGGSRLLDGNSEYATALEATIASFHNAEVGCLFNSGFDANAGFFACVPQPGDVIVYDAAIHASVHEGMRQSRAGVRAPFEHNDVGDLERVLQKAVAEDAQVKRGERNVFVAVESLYSMDGDVAPLKEIVEVVEPIILCSPLTKEYLINYARPLIYTTFMSYPSLVAIRTVYDLMMSGGTAAAAAHLWKLVVHLHTRLLALPHCPTNPILRIPKQCPQSPIFALLTPQPRSLARTCQEAGYVVRAIVAPTVPLGMERVRVCLHAGNSLAEVEALVGIIRKWVQTGGSRSVKHKAKI